ncbi:MAG: DUF72 domain-containing protein, partial [Thermoprotei archaeon]|nr:DUF72 domain-containing protein [Thermoprotei archaeon]
VIHVFDPLKSKPLSSHEVAYIRLHGLNGEVNYRYKYKEEDLERLASSIAELKRNYETIYVLFNNIYMKDDALRFREVLKKKLGSQIMIF